MSGSAKNIPVVMYDMPEEKAYAAIATLTNVVKHERPHITVYSGHHEVLGPVYIVLPPMGDPVVLPLFQSIVSAPVNELESELLHIPASEIELSKAPGESPLELRSAH